MKKELKTLQNFYLREEDTKKKNSAFYGEFFVITELDDGWNQNLYKKFLDFYEKFNKSDLSLEVLDQTEKTNGLIKIILSADEVGENTQKNILELTTKIQQDFLFTPIYQNINFGFPDDTILPVKLEEPDSEKHLQKYNRFKIQELFARILFLESEIERLEYIVNILDNEQDEISIAETNALKILIGNYRKEINFRLIPQKDELIKKFYLTAAITPLQTDGNTLLSEQQALAITDFIGDRSEKNPSKLLAWMKQMEDLYKSSIESNKKLEEKFETQTMQFIGEVRNLVSSSGVEVQASKKGILTDLEVNETDFLKRAKIVGVPNSDVYFLDGKYFGFEIDGINQDIKDIRVLAKNSAYAEILALRLADGTKVLCESKTNRYEVIKIDGLEKYCYLEELKYLIDGGIQYLKFHINDECLKAHPESTDCENVLVYKDDNAEFKKLELDGETTFSYIKVKMLENNKPFFGTISPINMSVNYDFIFKDGKYEYLKVEGEKINTDFESLSFKDDVLLSGLRRISFQNRQFFYLENTGYKFLEIEGEKTFSRFYDIKYDDNRKPIYGLVETNESIKKFFYLENGKYKFFEFNGNKQFDEIKFERQADGKVLLGKIKNNGKTSIFQFIDGKYEVMDFDGIKEFDNPLSLERVEDGKIFILGESLEGFLNKYYFLDSDGKYKLFKIGSQEKFKELDIYSLDYDENGVLLSGEAAIRDARIKYKFYRDDNQQFKFERTALFFKKKVD